MINLPETDTETQLKNHLRSAANTLANVGSALTMKGGKDDLILRDMVLESMQDIMEATNRFKELRS